jgi:hypothetical protein
MAVKYTIVCVNKGPSSGDHRYQHVESVGTGSRTWTVQQVLTAEAAGDVFVTRSPSTGREARVLKYTCAKCQRDYLRSSADHEKDNNLDELRAC